ncbi:serine/threonine-protein kinase PRP4 homolog isoform X2 [Cylas formicarius]|nr:serine/threonine-protein kinase PRP4 homolog isoform X2 [Cylas formicarius]
MELENKVPVSDDEEDLEALRLAALQSLKRKAAGSNCSQQISEPNTFALNEFGFRAGIRSHRGFSNKRGRYFGGRGLKNGQFFNARVRTSNLISITPVSSEEDKVSENADDTSTKLILPQDRYCNKSKSEEKQDESSSKFDRYNDSDESDEESEEELSSQSEDLSPSKLERSKSLEALMKELDDEIQGTLKSGEKEDKPKVKTKNKKTKETMKEDVQNDEAAKKKTVDTEVISETEITEGKNEVVESNALNSVPNESGPKPKRRRLSPIEKKEFHSRNMQRNVHSYSRPQYLPSLPVPFPSLGSNVLPIFNPNLAPPIVMVPPSNPLFYDRPLSPLSLNADTLQTQTLAPLSPRSAAFVLENRAIIEKRKRSPRRSYSRSLSPRSRSMSPRSPRRSLTPRRRSRSPKRRTSPANQAQLPAPRGLISPKRRLLSPKRRSLTPKRKSPSPRRRSLSPRRRSTSPKRGSRRELRTSPKLKPHIKERLGLKSQQKPETKVDKEKNSSNSSPKKEEKPLDPVLEARKRKFESKELRVKEGVIKLKPKEETKVEPPLEKEETKLCNVTENNPKDEENADVKEEKLDDLEEFNEDSLLEDYELDLEAKVHLFSDEEESGSENEGRFKEKEHNNIKPPILPFSKLLNGVQKDVQKPSPKSEKPKKESVKESKETSTSKKENEPKKMGSSKPVSKRTRSSPSQKSQIVLKSDRYPPKKFDRKIEIKIKNPSKYEKGAKSKQTKETDIKVKEKSSTKLITKDDEYESIEREPEKDVEVEEVASCSEVDLRAQLSKKRAEKMNKVVAPEQVPSRLLQNALQNALQKTSRSKGQEFSSSDGKLPIHLRLGLAGHTDVFSKPKRKSRKRKSREVPEQV